jgi:hypothetical protein
MPKSLRKREPREVYGVRMRIGDAIEYGLLGRAGEGSRSTEL